MNKSTNLWAVAEKYGIFIIFFIAILVFACINPKMVHPDQLFSVLLNGRRHHRHGHRRRLLRHPQRRSHHETEDSAVHHDARHLPLFPRHHAGLYGQQRHDDRRRTVRLPEGSRPWLHARRSEQNLRRHSRLCHPAVRLSQIRLRRENPRHRLQRNRRPRDGHQSRPHAHRRLCHDGFDGRPRRHPQRRDHGFLLAEGRQRLRS